MGYLLVAEGNGSFNPTSNTSRIGDIEIPGDKMGINLLLSAFAACISKKVSMILDIKTGMIDVKIEAYSSTDSLLRGGEPPIEKLTIHISVPQGYDVEDVREAAKKCPGLRLIIDKVDDIIVRRQMKP